MTTEPTTLADVIARPSLASIMKDFEEELAWYAEHRDKNYGHGTDDKQTETSEQEVEVILSALRVAQDWYHAWSEWKFLADKGDGMPVEVERALEIAEAALAAAFGPHFGPQEASTP